MIMLIIFPAVIFSQNTENANNLAEFNEWQVIVDGQAGEGAIFYRFNFNKNGNVKITKQAGGIGTLVEEKKWNIQNSKITIKSNSGDKITEFDGAKLSISDKNNIVYENGPI